MEHQLSVLLYSKYSTYSKKLMDMIKSSGVDFTGQFKLQPLCIDNEEIRKRISQNKQIQVTTVPCILIIYPDGGIEKYDDVYAFQWVESVIHKFALPPPPQPTEEEQWRRQQAEEQRRITEQKHAKELEREQIKEENRRKYEERHEEPKQSPKRSRRRRIKKQRSPSRSPVKSQVTAIEDLPSDENDDTVSDRYRSRKPIGRIRTNEGNYEENDDLFPGTPPDVRRARRSDVRGVGHTGDNSAKTKKSMDLMAKAKEMAKSREDPSPPSGHPMNSKN